MSANIFSTLNAIDVSKHLEKKDKFSYLSWPYAIDELQKADPAATWEVIKFPLPDAPHVLAPVCITPFGCFVEVAVVAGGKRLTQVHPVLDQRNQAIKSPDAGAINKSIMRCLVKAIALHGLGLNVYAGEDVPLGDDDDNDTLKKAPPKTTPKPPPVKAAQPPPTTSPKTPEEYEKDRIKELQQAIAGQMRRLGIVGTIDAKDEAAKKAAQERASAEMKTINGGLPPRTAEQFENVLAVLKEMSPDDVSAAEFAKRKDKAAA
jgi:hypothetical protein